MTKNSSFFIELSWVHQLLGAPIFCSPPQATPLHLIYKGGAASIYGGTFEIRPAISLQISCRF